MLRNGSMAGSRGAIVVLLLLVSMSSIACSVGGERAVVLHPISERDIVMLDAGDTLVAPCAGAFVSDFYIKEVMKVRVGR